MTAPDFSQWKMNHTMIRVKDPAESIAFYNRLGLVLIDILLQPSAKFDLYFLGYDYPTSDSAGKDRSDRQGLLELTHNYGTEHDDSYHVSTGNDGLLGFEHLGISVGNLRAVCKTLDELGATWHEKIEMGSPNRAICKDSDGYYVEIVSESRNADSEETAMNIETHVLNHTGLRVKNPKTSLSWYREVLGMTVFEEVKGDGFTHYFMGYNDDTQEDSRSLFSREGMVKLVWIHRSENKEGKVYHNGNIEPQGFGHLAVAVDDIEVACEFFQQRKVTWKKRLTQGRMKSIAFIQDPDDYWIEIIQNARIKVPLGIQ
ncbi:hypothetical protein VF21_04369 [Pseudogymnoascus sp. 05NY08]|nr:hypothetical protein VF21_04369 [Pseudogymnoascus sp. 05NY08]